MNYRNSFQRRCATSGAAVTYHREDGGTLCPCFKDGSRQPEWHLANPLEPVCNQQGKLDVNVTAVVFKGFVQPTRIRQQSQVILQLFGGEVETDDQVGIFPLTWGNVNLDFRNWGEAGEDWLKYAGIRYNVVGASTVPDPGDGEPHHWECALRVRGTGRAIA